MQWCNSVFSFVCCILIYFFLTASEYSCFHGPIYYTSKIIFLHGNSLLLTAHHFIHEMRPTFSSVDHFALNFVSHSLHRSRFIKSCWNSSTFLPIFSIQTNLISSVNLFSYTTALFFPAHSEISQTALLTQQAGILQQPNSISDLPPFKNTPLSPTCHFLPFFS